MLHLTATATGDGFTVACLVAPALIVPLVWSAAAAAPAEWRRFAWLAATALSCQVAAGWVWGVVHFTGDEPSISAPGAWTPLLYAALLAASAATWTAVRPRAWSRRRRREAVLDCSMGLAALTCVAAAALDRELIADWAVIDAGLRTLAGVLLLVMLGSATWGRWPGGSVLVALTGVSIGGYVLCSVTATIAAAGVSVGPVLPGVLWVFAALSAMLVPAAARRGVDRPVVCLNAAAIPGASPTSLTLSWSVTGTIAVGIGAYGALTGNTTVLVATMAAVSWIGLAGMLRAIGALRAIRARYLELDEALFRRELADDQAELATYR